jgi:hypothetical protein
VGPISHASAMNEYERVVAVQQVCNKSSFPTLAIHTQCCLFKEQWPPAGRFSEALDIDSPCQHLDDDQRGRSLRPREQFEKTMGQCLPEVWGRGEQVAHKSRLQRCRGLMGGAQDRISCVDLRTLADELHVPPAPARSTSGPSRLKKAREKSASGARQRLAVAQ